MDYKLQQKAELIWSTLNTIQNSKKSKDEQIDLIKDILIEMNFEERQIGRNQIINNIQDQLNGLK